MNKKLNLKKEVLAELTSDELTRVAGGSHDCVTFTVDVLQCLSRGFCEQTHEAACHVPTLRPQSCAC